MTTRRPALVVALLAGFLLAGCSRPSSPSQSGSQGAPPGQGAPAGQGSFEPKEEYALETGLKKDDGKPAGMQGLAVSADGKLVLAMAALSSKGNVQVWDLPGHKKLYEYDNRIGSILPVAISPDGKLGAYPTQQSPCVVLVDLTNGKEVRRLRKKGNEPLDPYTPDLAFSPRGDLLVAASGKEVIGWNPATGDVRFAWQEPADIESMSSFFDDGKKIATGTAKGSVKVWDVEAGKAVQTLAEKGDDKVAALFVSPDGKRLGAYIHFGPIRIYDLSTGNVTKEVRGKPGLSPSIHFLQDNRTLAYNGDWDLNLLDTEKGETKTFDKTTDVRHEAVALTQDGATLLAGSDDGKIHVWKLK